LVIITKKKAKQEVNTEKKDKLIEKERNTHTYTDNEIINIYFYIIFNLVYFI